MLIEKEDAKKAICEVCYMYKYIGDEYKECKYYPCDDINALEAIPSAEQVTGKLKNPCDSLLTGELDECKEHQSKLESAEAVQGWRTDKPTENGEYMVTIDAWGHRYIDVMHYAKPLMPNREVDGTCWYRDDDEWGDVVYDDSDILAWMPLPKPYKGGDDE